MSEFGQTLVIVSPFMVCLFWTAVLALEWREAYPAKRLLAVFMGVSTVLYMCHGVFFAGDEGLMPAAGVAYSFCNLAVFPLYWLYIFRLTHARPVGTRHLAVLLPAAALCLWTWADDGEARMAAQRVVFVVQLVPVSWSCFRQLYVFDRDIANNYADTELRTVKRTREVMGVLVVTSLCSAAANYVGREYFAGNMAVLALPSAAFSLLLFAVGYVGMKQTFSADTMQSEDEDYMPAQEGVEMDVGMDADMVVDANADVDEGAASDIAEAGPHAAGLSAAELSAEGRSEAYLSAEGSPMTNRSAEGLSATEGSDTIGRRLTQAIEDGRLYLKPDLRLMDVARALGVGRNQLSAYINQTMGLSFSDYINQLRVRHAQRMIAADRNLSLLYISEQSGFSTEAAFYRAFRKHVGMTPRQWSCEAGFRF